MIFIVVLLTAAAGMAGTPDPPATAQRYCESIMARDFEAFQSLFTPDQQKQLHESLFRSIQITKCELISETAPHAVIRFRLPLSKDWPEETGVLYIQPDGKIKYDPIFLIHPAILLDGLIQQMENDDVRFRQSASHSLADMKIPIFGYDPEAAPEIRAASMKQFRKWVRRNRFTYDTGTVKIPVSPIDLERFKKAAQIR